MSNATHTSSEKTGLPLSFAVTKRQQIVERIRRWGAMANRVVSDENKIRALKELDRCEKELEAYDIAQAIDKAATTEERLKLSARTALADGSHVASTRATLAYEEIKSAREREEKREKELAADSAPPSMTIQELAAYLAESISQTELVELLLALSKLNGVAYRKR